MEIGHTVQLKQPVIAGPIVDTRYNKDARCLEHLVEYTDAGGETHSRWFLETDLREVA